MSKVQQTADGSTTAMRWTARIIALLAVGLFVFFAIDLGARVFPALDWGPQGIPLLIAVGVALALERRAAQLAGLAAKLQPGEDINALLDRQRVFFRDKRDVGVQLRRWPAHKLERLVPRLTELHRNLLGNSQTAGLVLAQALTQIARFAARRR